MSQVIDVLGNASAWQTLLSGFAVIAAVWVAYWQDVQRRRSERNAQRITRVAAASVAQFASDHVSRAAAQMREALRDAPGPEFDYPTYLFDQADEAMAAFPVHTLDQVEGIKGFLLIRNRVASARIRLSNVIACLRAGRDATSHVGGLTNEARMLEEACAALWQVLAPAKTPAHA